MRGYVNSLSHVYEHPGPFATVYLDASRSTEAGGREVRLRWESLRDQLRNHGADARTLSALDDALAGPEGTAGTGRHGRVLVATDGAVCFDAKLPSPPAREHATWSPLPHLMPYLAQRSASSPDIPYVVAAIDQTGADIRTWRPESGPVTQTVQGSRQYPLRKSATDDWSEWHFQNRVEESVEANARDVADAVAAQAARIAAEVVILVGEPHSVSLVRQQARKVLGPRADVVVVSAGGRGNGSVQWDRSSSPHSSAEALSAAVDEQLWRKVWRDRHELLQRLRQNLGRGEYAVAGLPQVVEAVRQAQADTVLISDNPSSPLHAWIGPEPAQLGLDADEVRAMGVSEPAEERLDAALLRAMVGTDSELVVTPNAHGFGFVPDGIAALLRY